MGDGILKGTAQIRRTAAALGEGVWSRNCRSRTEGEQEKTPQCGVFVKRYPKDREKGSE